MCRWLLGAAQAQRGSTTEGIRLIQNGIASLLQMQQRIAITLWTGCLAAAYERAGDLGQALAAIEDALQGNPEEFAYRPELLRQRGDLQLKRGQTELAEIGFREAIALGRNMQAKAWELRATMNLARMLATQGKRSEASTMLAEIFSWFTEGFDTADLKEAKALLTELGA